MQSVDASELDALIDRWAKLLQDYPGIKGELMERVGKRMEQAVRGQVRASGMKDGGSKVAGWQKYYVGSRRGYAAVRAIGSSEGAAPGPNSPGAITNYTELGHLVRQASGKSGKRRASRRKVGAVKGYHYYERSEGQVEEIGSIELPAFAAEIAARLGGKE